MYNIPNIPTIYIFLNMTCWVHIMLFVCMSTELTIQHSNDNCCAFPWGHHFFCSQLYSIACSSLCWVEALGALHCSLWHDCWCLLLGEVLRVLLLIFLVDTISQQTPWFLCPLEPFLPSLLWCFLSLICGLKVKASLLWQPVKCYYWRQVPQQLFATWDWMEINHLSTGWFLCVIYKHVAVAHWWSVCLPSMHVAHHIKIIVCNLQISLENKMLFLDFGCWCV